MSKGKKCVLEQLYQVIVKKPKNKQSTGLVSKVKGCFTVLKNFEFKSLIKTDHFYNYKHSTVLLQSFAVRIL